MRIAIALAALTLSGCSSLLGITDPIPGDAPAGRERLELNVSNLRVAQPQMLRVRVQRILVSGTSEDWTQQTQFATSDNAVVAVGIGGEMTTREPGTATITASFAGADPATLTITVTDEPCHPVINELQTAGAAGPSDEWVELYNPCAIPYTVDGWTLGYLAASGSGAATLVTLAGEMAAGELRLYAGQQYPGAPDMRWGGGADGQLQRVSAAVALRNGATRIDSIAYGQAVIAAHPFIEGTATAGLDTGVSASRLPIDGKDENNGATDFVVVNRPTPDALNAP